MKIKTPLPKSLLVIIGWLFFTFLAQIGSLANLSLDLGYPSIFSTLRDENLKFIVGSVFLRFLIFICVVYFVIIRVERFALIAASLIAGGYFFVAMLLIAGNGVGGYGLGSMLFAFAIAIYIIFSKKIRECFSSSEVKILERG